MFSFIKKFLGQSSHGKTPVAGNIGGKARTKTRANTVKLAFEKVKSENQERDTRIDKIYSQLNSHSAKLEDYGKVIQQIQNQVGILDQKIISLQNIGVLDQINRLNEPTNRLNEPANRLNATNRATERPMSLSNLSAQEKRIITALLDHKGISLSYADIAKVLGKSINTVKTQINQLKAKTNLLAEVIDEERKKRYKLKENLRLEQFLSTN